MDNTQTTTRKCNNCGEVLLALSSSCQSCGRELSDVEVNRAIKALADKFEAIEHDCEAKGIVAKAREKEICERKARVIRDYPIPHARDDLQQLLYYIQPKLIDSIKPDPNIEDWRIKFNEVLNRAKKAYQDNPVMLREFDEMEAATGTSISESLEMRAKRYPMFVAGLVASALIAIGVIMKFHFEGVKRAQCDAMYVKGAALEKDRLNKIFAAVNNDFQQQKYAEAAAESSQIRWDYRESCDGEESQKQEAIWNAKRTELAATIEKSMKRDMAEKIAADAQVAAERKAEVERAKEERTEFEAQEALKARMAAETEEANAEKAEKAKKVAARDSKW